MSYLVDDVQTAVDFYTTHLGFTVSTQAPAFADVFHGRLRLLLTDPTGNLIELFQTAHRPGPSTTTAAP